MKLLVGNIQRYCIDDGPGIRTTVFLKGCTIHCPWCANPENLEKTIQISKIDNDLIFGKWYSVSEIFDECKKDILFYNKGGGVTVSGGEPLIWANELSILFKQLHSEGISTCAETSLFVESDNVKLLLPLLDSIIIDIKILELEKCRQILGGNLEMFYANLKLIEEFGLNIVFRIPLVADMTFTNENIKKIKEFILQRPNHHFEIFKCHNIAEQKYRHLQKSIPIYKEIDNELIKIFITDLKSHNCSVSYLSL